MTSTKYVGQGMDLGGTKLTSVGSPSVGTDAANKAYVDNVAAGLDAKPSARAASTANLTLSATQTIDGVAVIAGDRVLVKNQTTASANGIYVCAGGAWALATDSTQGNLTAGALVSIEEGTTNGGKSYVLTTPNPITVGTTSQVWSPFSAGSSYLAGNGLSLTASTFAVVAGSGIIADGTSTRVDPAFSGLVKRNSGTVASGSTTVTIAHGFGVVPYAVQILDASGNLVEPDIQLTSTNIVLTFATAPTVSQFTWQALA